MDAVANTFAGNAYGAQDKARVWVAPVDAHERQQLRSGLKLALKIACEG